MRRMIFTKAPDALIECSIKIEISPASAGDVFIFVGAIRESPAGRRSSRRRGDLFVYDSTVTICGDLMYRAIARFMP